MRRLYAARHFVCHSKCSQIFVGSWAGLRAPQPTFLTPGQWNMEKGHFRPQSARTAVAPDAIRISANRGELECNSARRHSATIRRQFET